jgi:hypothetical protein
MGCGYASHNVAKKLLVFALKEEILLTDLRARRTARVHLHAQERQLAEHDRMRVLGRRPPIAG